MLQQVLERNNEVLCVLTQKIVTTQPCVISEHIQLEEKCGGMVGIQTKTVQVCGVCGVPMRPPWSQSSQLGPWPRWVVSSCVRTLL